MKPPAFAYQAPHGLEQALALLAEHGGEARLLAGGQSLMPALNFRLTAPSVLIDLNGIAELAQVSVAPDGLRLARLTRHRRIETDAAIAAANPLLATAAPYIAHWPIRTRGTLGGSLAHADPAAEWPAVCLAGDATMLVCGPLGAREVAAEDFTRGVYATALATDEILTAVRFPAWPAVRRHGFAEVARRQGDFALIGAAVTLDRAADGRCTDCRIVLFGTAGRPLRRRDAEAMLRDVCPDAATIRNAAAVAVRGIDWHGDLHASAEYRRRVAPVMIRRALEQAIA